TNQTGAEVRRRAIPHRGPRVAVAINLGRGPPGRRSNLSASPTIGPPLYASSLPGNTAPRAPGTSLARREALRPAARAILANGLPIPNGPHKTWWQLPSRAWLVAPGSRAHAEPFAGPRRGANLPVGSNLAVKAPCERAP